VKWVINGTASYRTQEKRVMEEDATKVKGFRSYNILPLETPENPAILNPFEHFSEVRSSEIYPYVMVLLSREGLLGVLNKCLNNFIQNIKFEIHMCALK
jgi:hypothetical protein